MTKRASVAVPIKISADANNLLWNREAAILDTTELLCELMKEAGVSRADLAARMGTTKSNITQILDGSRNMTIRTVSDVMTHLGHEFRASCKDRETKTPPYAVYRVIAEIQIPMKDISPAFNAIPQNIELQPMVEYPDGKSLLTSLVPCQLAGA